MAFVSAIPFQKTRFSATSVRSSRRDSNVVRSMAAPASGRSQVYQDFLDSSNPLMKAPTKKVVETTPGVPEGRSAYFMTSMNDRTKKYYGGPTKVAPVAVGPAEVSSTLSTASSPFFRLAAEDVMKGYGSMGNARVKTKTPFERRVDDYIAACAKRQSNRMRCASKSNK